MIIHINEYVYTYVKYVHVNTLAAKLRRRELLIKEIQTLQQQNARAMVDEAVYGCCCTLMKKKNLIAKS